MARIQRVRVSLTGMSGGPGVSTFYFLDASTSLNALTALWNGLALLMPSTVTVHVENSGDVIEATTGTLVDVWAGPSQVTFPGAVTTGYAAPAGVALTWLTPVIVDGHRLKGRSFVVPMAAVIYQPDGSIEPSNLTDIASKAATFVTATASNFVVWHRPFPGAPAVGTKPARPAFLGSFGLVTSSVVKDKVAILRSRRD